jgi:hypothetical protein
MHKSKPLWRRRLSAALTPRRQLQVFESDTLPARLPRVRVALARDDGEDWCIGMRCPCGCGQRLELLVLDGVKPRWDFHLNRAGYVTVHPSVWLTTGCRSHFWLRNGKVIWCE